MPIFISYSRKDRGFVDSLAANLVRLKHHIWMDRWELNVGDSLVDRIQNALGSSGAILLVISKNSIESSWCKKEVNSGLIRELEESKTLLLPCIIDDCEIPLFLREKLYADFRADPDEALEGLNRALAAISNPEQGRVDQNKYFTDWAVDWKITDGDQYIDLSFVDHGHEWPYVVLVRCLFMCQDRTAAAFNEMLREDKPMEFVAKLLQGLIESCGPEGLSVLIEDARETLLHRHLKVENGLEAGVVIGYRRMGADTGMDTVVHVSQTLQQALDHIISVPSRPSKNK